MDKEAIKEEFLRFKEMFENRKDVKERRRKYMELMRSGDMVRAMRVAKSIDSDWEAEMEKIRCYRESISDMLSQTDPETRGCIMMDLYALAFMSDAYITVIDDLKSRIKGINDKSTFSKFDYINDLVKECYYHVDEVLCRTSRRFQEDFAINSDEFAEMVLGYAKEKAIKEKEEHPEEGEA